MISNTVLHIDSGAQDVLHDRKSEETIIQIFARVLPLLTAKPIIVKSDCAQEYHTPKMEAFLKDSHGVKETRHSNEHNQAANGMVEIFCDTLGRGLRVALLQSGLPLAFWGAAFTIFTTTRRTRALEAIHHIFGAPADCLTCHYLSTWLRGERKASVSASEHILAAEHLYTTQLEPIGSTPAWTANLTPLFFHSEWQIRCSEDSMIKSLSQRN